MPLLGPIHPTKLAKLGERRGKNLHETLITPSYPKISQIHFYYIPLYHCCWLNHVKSPFLMVKPAWFSFYRHRRPLPLPVHRHIFCNQTAGCTTSGWIIDPANPQQARSLFQWSSENWILDQDITKLCGKKPSTSSGGPEKWPLSLGVAGWLAQVPMNFSWRAPS